MGQGYQERDYEIIDYELYKLEEFKLPFRGPKPSSLEKNNFFTCVGAAQTFGCYTKKPFSALLRQAINLEVLNAGFAGAGPLFFLKNEKYIQMANFSKFVIVQVMSGRSESNRIFECQQGRGMLFRKNDNRLMMAEPAYDEFLKSADQNQIAEVIEETRQNYLSHIIELLGLIKVPKILFWFSERIPDYQPTYDNARSLFGKYPQLVNQEILEQIIPHADYYVQCISSIGMPQKLKSRFTGKEVSVLKHSQLGNGKRKYNSYYPSPEMHQLAFEALYPVCKEIMFSYNSK